MKKTTITRTKLNKLAQELGSLQAAIRRLLPWEEEPASQASPLQPSVSFNFNMEELLAAAPHIDAEEEGAGTDPGLPPAGTPDTVGIAAELVQAPFPAGEIAGVGCQETGYFYYFSRADVPGTVLPSIYNTAALVVPSACYQALIHSDVCLEGYEFVASFLDGQNLALSRCTEGYPTANTIVFEPEETIFSRNRGICDVNTLKNKVAVLVGCGSVGGTAACYLARAGVGELVLVDSDALKPHNIARHELDMTYLGKFKVHALADKIKVINPQIKIRTFPCTLAEAADQLDRLDLKDGLVFASADSRAANAQANELAARHNIPYVAVGAFSRAAIAEVFYWRPGKNQRTYGEVFGKLIAEAPAERDPSHDYYVGQKEEMELVQYEPAIFTDITMLTLIGVRVALDLLQLENPDYQPRLLNDIKRYNLWCNTTVTHEPSRSLFTGPLQLRTFAVEGDPVQADPKKDDAKEE